MYIKKDCQMRGGEHVMKTRLLLLTLALTMLAATGSATEIGPDTILGPGKLPVWGDHAQVRLGWVFADPLFPKPTDLVDDVYWNTYIGDEQPEWFSKWEWHWDPDFNWKYGDTQLYLEAPNVPLNRYERVWLSVVRKDLDFVGSSHSYVIGDEGVSANIVRGPVVEYFVPDDPAQWLHASRTTTHYSFWPHSSCVEFWIGGTSGHGPFVTEVYLMTEGYIIPEPATMSLLGMGLAGLAYRRFRNRKKS